MLISRKVWVAEQSSITLMCIIWLYDLFMRWFCWPFFSFFQAKIWRVARSCYRRFVSCKLLMIFIPITVSGSTLFLFQKMMHNAERVTIYWDFVKSLEPPRVVHIRTNDVFFKGNTFAQVTVRFFSKQVSIPVHNLEISEFFSYSDFTRNPL